MTEDEAPHLADVLGGRAEADVHVSARMHDEFQPVLDRPRFAGDVQAGGPLPELAAVLQGYLSFVFIAVMVAAGAAAISMESIAERSDISASWLGAFVAVGAHPGVVLLWAIWLFGGTWVAFRIEQGNRRVLWATVIPALLIAGASYLGAEDPDLYLHWTSLGLIDDEFIPLAQANISAHWWLFGLTFGLGYWYARSNDKLVLTGFLCCALFVTWEIDAARFAEWSGGSDLTMAGLFRAAFASSNASEMGAVFARTGLVIHARSAADLVLLLAPVLEIRTQTNRALGAYGTGAWRAARPV